MPSDVRKKSLPFYKSERDEFFCLIDVYLQHILNMDKKIKELLLECTGFEWDEGNRDKNWIKHKVSNSECEEIFFNQPLIINFDKNHSKIEIRFYALGHTDLNRKLFIVFTIRNKKIRVISARDMSKKERKIYEAIK